MSASVEKPQNDVSCTCVRTGLDRRECSTFLCADTLCPTCKRLLENCAGSCNRLRAGRD